MDTIRRTTDTPSEARKIFESLLDLSRFGSTFIVRGERAEMYDLTLRGTYTHPLSELIAYVQNKYGRVNAGLVIYHMEAMRSRLINTFWAEENPNIPGLLHYYRQDSFVSYDEAIKQVEREDGRLVQVEHQEWVEIERSGYVIYQTDEEDKVFMAPSDRMGIHFQTRWNWQIKEIRAVGDAAVVLEFDKRQHRRGIISMVGGSVSVDGVEDGYWEDYPLQVSGHLERLAIFCAFHPCSLRRFIFTVEGNLGCVDRDRWFIKMLRFSNVYEETLSVFELWHSAAEYLLGLLSAKVFCHKIGVTPPPLIWVLSLIDDLVIRHPSFLGVPANLKNSGARGMRRDQYSALREKVYSYLEKETLF